MAASKEAQRAATWAAQRAEEKEEWREQLREESGRLIQEVLGHQEVWGGQLKGEERWKRSLLVYLGAFHHN